MKATKLYMAGFGVLSSLLLLSSCKRELDPLLEEEFNFANTAQVQVYNATVGASARTYVYVDGKPVTGAAMGYGTSFPSNAYSFTIPAGMRAFVVKDTAVNPVQPQLVFSENFQSNKKYTIFTYDTSNAIKQITIESDIRMPADTTARLRFANFAFSKVAVPGVDIYSARRKENIFTNVQIKEVTNFIPYASFLPDTFYVRYTGTGANIINLVAPTTTGQPYIPTPIRLIFTPVEKRNYTLIFRGGYMTDTAAKATARTLSSFTNL